MFIGKISSCIVHTGYRYAEFDAIEKDDYYNTPPERASDKVVPIDVQFSFKFRLIPYIPQSYLQIQSATCATLSPIFSFGEYEEKSMEVGDQIEEDQYGGYYDKREAGNGQGEQETDYIE
ncbi:MAG: hypothetical protein EZS28_014853, partial [Streblomastix strix]